MNTEREKRMIEGMRENGIKPHRVRNEQQARAIAAVDEKGRVWRPGTKYYVFCTVSDGAEYVKIYED